LDHSTKGGGVSDVFFGVNGTEICGRVEPSSAGDAGATMRLHANVDHMHLIDPASGAVI
jgi:multiple sugar transport system ATP-binding protein